MRHAALIAVAALCVTSACTSPQVTDVNPVPVAGDPSESYPAALRQGILNKCHEGGAAPAMCYCLLGRMEASIPADKLGDGGVSAAQAQAWGDECREEIATSPPSQGTPLPPEIRDGVMRECTPKMGAPVCRCVVEKLERTYSLEDILEGRMSNEKAKGWEAECKAAKLGGPGAFRAKWVGNCRQSLPFPDACDCLFGRLEKSYSQQEIESGAMNKAVVQDHIKVCVPQTSTATAGTRWPEAARKAFMDNCAEKFPREVCACGLEKTEARYSVQSVFNETLDDKVLLGFLHACAQQ